MTCATCLDAQSLRSHLRDVSMDRHEVACVQPSAAEAPCPYEAWRRDGDEAFYDQERGPLGACPCCESCRASCAGDAA